MDEDIWQINHPLPLNSLRGNFFDGRRSPSPLERTCHIKDSRIAGFTKRGNADIVIPDRTLIIPGGIDTHVHGRDAHGIKPGDKGDQSYKEDSYTVSLALGHGGATFAMCMCNFASYVETDEQYDAQLESMNSELPHRKKPIMRLGAYVTIKPGSKPEITRPVWYKCFWKTFAGTFETDEQVIETLRNYRGRRVKVHCETIADIIENASMPHHVRRPGVAAINATKIVIQCARDYGLTIDVAHISTPEEIDLVREAQREGVKVYSEITPQSLTLDHTTFKEATGLPMIWGQQNPPLRSFFERMAMRHRIKNVTYFSTDHAPHTKEENERGISGMPQADTAGQVYLELVSDEVIDLARYVEMRSTTPGKILEKQLGLKMGKLEPGYDANFTLVSLNKPSRIRDEDVLSKCGWTPYRNMEFRNAIEGVVVGGILYTAATLRELRQAA